MQFIVQSIKQNVITAHKAEVEFLVHEAIAANLPIEEILNEGLIAAMGEVGARFEAGDIYIPEMLVAARAMQAGLVILKPFLVSKGILSTGKIVIGTVKGDLHDVGKNLVIMMLEGAGFEVIDLGADVNPEKFIAAVKERDAQIVGMSALLTTTMDNMKLVITALKDSGLRNRVKVMIGGAPVTNKYAQEIGADGYAPDASRAVTLAKSLLHI